MNAPFCGVLAALGLGLLALAPRPAAAQSYPDRPIRLIIPFAPGGGTDVVARVAASCMSQGLGQQVVIDNRPGAGGTIGTEIAAKAAPDGYTLVSLTLSSAVLNTFLYHRLPFDTRRDLTAIAEIGRSPNIITVRPNLPARDVAGLIAHARANPGAVTYGSGGNGTIVHMAGVLLAKQTGTQMTHVPFRGGGPALQAIMAGQIDFMVDSLPVVQAQVRDGSIRGLAVTASRRLAAFPDMPTAAEAGLPDYENGNWFGIFGPAALPRPIVDRLAAEVARVTADPTCRRRLEEIGVDATGAGPAAFSAFWDRELAYWGPVVRESGATVE